MDEVPLIDKVQKNDINTTIIAIKKQLKELNALLGLIDIQSDKQDLSPYVRKDEVIDEVKRFDLSPVTSNAVSKALSYSTSEVKTGGYWIDGKKIYRVVRHVRHNGAVTSGYSYSSSAKAYSGTFTIDCETPVSASVVYKAEGGRWGREYSQGWDSSSNIVWINDNSVYNHLAVNCLEVYIILEYTKTTD